MKTHNWVVITLAVALIGCATPPKMIGQDPVHGTAADVVGATVGWTAPTMTAVDGVNIHLGSGVVRPNRDNGFDLTDWRTTQHQPRPEGTPIDSGFTWSGGHKAAVDIGLRDRRPTESSCRWVLAPKLALIPDLQLLKNPAF